MSGELQTNAADVRQVKRAKGREKSTEAQNRDDLRWVMSTRQGRRWLRRQLARHRLFESITVQSSMIYALSGRRDAGLEMLAEAVEHEELYLQMEREAREDARLEERENAAARVARVTD